MDDLKFNSGNDEYEANEWYRSNGYDSELKKGYWKLAFTEEENVYECSVCGELFLLNDGTPYDNAMRYCPRCGAKLLE